MVNCTLALKIVYALSSIPVVDTFIFFNIKLIKHKSWSFPVSPGQSWSVLLDPSPGGFLDLCQEWSNLTRNPPGILQESTRNLPGILSHLVDNG